MNIKIADKAPRQYSNVISFNFDKSEKNASKKISDLHRKINRIQAAITLHKGGQPYTKSDILSLAIDVLDYELKNRMRSS